MNDSCRTLTFGSQFDVGKSTGKYLILPTHRLFLGEANKSAYINKSKCPQQEIPQNTSNTQFIKPP